MGIGHPLGVHFPAPPPETRPLRRSRCPEKMDASRDPERVFGEGAEDSTRGRVRSPRICELAYDLWSVCVSAL